MGCHKFTTVVFLFALLALIVMPASAEWLMDFAVGGAFTTSADVTIQDPSTRTNGTGRFETSFTFDGRTGYFLERLPWLGLAVDASYFSPDAQVTVGSLTLDTAALTIVSSGIPRSGMGVSQ